MAAATRHFHGVGNRNGGRLLGVHGIQRMMFSSSRVGGTPTAAGGLEAPPPASYNQDYHHYSGQDYYNSTDDPSKISRDDYSKNMSNDQNRRLSEPDYNIKKFQQRIVRMEHNESEPDYDFKKLQQCIFRIEHDFARHCEKLHRIEHDFVRHCEKLHRISDMSLNEIRDERKKLINELSKISEEKMAETKEAMNTFIRDENMSNAIATIAWTVLFITTMAWPLLF